MHQSRYPVQILEGHDYVTVAEIFRRVNRQGKALITAEVELAKLIPYWPGVSGRFREFIRRMRRDGFNADFPFYMRCLAFIATDWPAIDYFSRQVADEPGKLNAGKKETAEYKPEQLNKYWERVEVSVRKLHHLLNAHDIDRTDFITTRNALVPMVYAIARDKKHKLDDGLLVKWLLYAMDGNHYARQTEGVLRRDSRYLTGTLPIEQGFAKMYRQMLRKEISSLKFDESDFEDIADWQDSACYIF
jgi:hypothetical protein